MKFFLPLFINFDLYTTFDHNAKRGGIDMHKLKCLKRSNDDKEAMFQPACSIASQVITGRTDPPC